MSRFEHRELDKQACYTTMWFYRRALYYSFLSSITSIPSPSFSVRTLSAIPPILFFLYIRNLLLFLYIPRRNISYFRPSPSSRVARWYPCLFSYMVFFGCPDFLSDYNACPPCSNSCSFFWLFFFIFVWDLSFSSHFLCHNWRPSLFFQTTDALRQNYWTQWGRKS
jgi:hypothetical protein